MSFDIPIGLGNAAIMPSQVERTPTPTEEVVPAALGFSPRFNYSLSRSFDDLYLRLGPKVYEAMLTDPAVASSVTSTKLAILDGGLSWTSPVKQPAWSKRPNLTKGEGTPDRQLTPEQSLGQEIYEFNDRGWKRIEANARQAAFAYLHAMVDGAKLGEPTWELMEEGLDAGKLVLKSVKVKPDWAWRFVVDNKSDVKGFLTYNPVGGYFVFPPEKFAWLTWMPKDSDPRGTSILRAAYNAWNLKIQAWPEYYAFVKRFGSPGLDFELAESDNTQRVPVDANGFEIANAAPVPIGDYYMTVLNVYANGARFVHPFGSKLTVQEPKSSGEAFLAGFDLFNREIMLAIEYQTRAALEAKHGSKADGDSATDRKGLLVSYGQAVLGDVFYRIAHRTIELNYGRDAADQFTPLPSFGNTEGHDKAANWAAAGSIGYTLGPSQMEEMDVELGIPTRDAVADAEAAQKAMEAQQALKPPPGEGKPFSKPSKPSKP